MTSTLAFQFFLLIGCLVLGQKSDTRSFDSGDWIPLAQPCLTCRDQGTKKGEDQQPQKSGRVLNVVPFPRELYNGPPPFRDSLYPAPNAQRFQHNQPLDVPPQHQILPHLDQHISQNAQTFQITPHVGQPFQEQPPNPSIHPQNRPALLNNVPENLTPPFLPLQDTHFNGNLQPPHLFAQTAQAFTPPNQQLIQQQYLTQPNLVQPHNDFHLLQQLLSSQNIQFSDLFELNQTQSVPKLTTQSEPGSDLRQNIESVQKVAPVVKKPQKPTAKPSRLSSSTTLTPKISDQKEEVQLLYVPLETLRQRGPAKVKQSEVATEKVFRSFETPFNEFYQPDYRMQSQLQTIQRDLNNEQTQQLRQQKVQPTPTTAKPVTSTRAPTKKKSKLKPHQPPLAVFMGSTSGSDIKVDDVLSVLKHARTISVLDHVTAEMPQVFVGPSSLKPPEGYSKFDLPYLSSLENNRVQRKVEQFPFFVAPLSYNTPDGYAKIPFPSPHVGSVIIKDMKEVHEKPETLAYNIYPNTYNQFNDNIKLADKPRARRPSVQASTVPPPNNAQYNPNIESQFIQNSDFLTGNPYLSSPNQYDAIQYNPSSTPASVETQTTAFKQYSAAQPVQHSTPSSQYSPDGHYITNAGFKQLSTYSSSPKPAIQVNPVLSQTSPPANDYKYTILEQFPIRQETTTQNVVKSYKDAEKTSTKSYSEFDFGKFRNNPLGINEEFSVVQNQYQNAQIPPKVEQGFSSTIRSVSRTPTISSTLANHQHFSVSPDAVEHVTQQSPKPSLVSSTTEQVSYRPPTTTPQQVYYQQPVLQSSTENINQQFGNIDPIFNQQIPQTQYRELNIPQLYQQNFNPKTYNQQSNFNPQANYVPQQQDINQQYKSTSEIPQTYQQQTGVHSSQVIGQPATQTRGKVQYSDVGAYYQQAGDPQYHLPAQLPPINPNLPGLINSLQDEQVYQQSSQAALNQETSESTASYQSTTQEPSTTTHSRRPTSRGRPRTQTRPTSVPSTTVSPNRSRNTSRRRRPYNGRPRPEYEKYLYNGQKDSSISYENSVSSTTTEKPTEISSTLETVVDITTPRPTRNRYTYQHDQQQSQTTEAPKRNVQQTRTRFRTRSRQPKPTTTTTEATTVEYPNGHQNKISMTERSSLAYSSTEPVNIFQQPQLEGGFQVSPPFSTHENVNVQHQYDQKFIPDQRPVYQHPQYQQSPQEYADPAQPSPYSINPQIPTQAYENSPPNYEENYSTPSTNSEISVQSTSEAAPIIKENSQFLIETSPPQPKSSLYNPNIVQSSLFDSEVISKPVSGQTEYVRFNGGTPQTTLLQKQEPITTRRTPVTRSRGRTRTRGRTYSSTTEQVPTTTPSTTTSTEISIQHEQEEYYGFIRQPFEQQHPEQVYEQSSPKYRNDELTGTEPPQYFSPTERVSSSSEETFINDNIAHSPPLSPVFPTYIEQQRQQQSQEPQEVKQYLPQEQTSPHIVYSTSELSVPQTDEITTRRHFLNKAPINRFVRPTNGPSYTTSQRSPSGKYTVRPTKRPELEAPKITKIRGRIRKPAPATTTTTQETIDQEEYIIPINNQPIYSSRTPYAQQQSAVNELAGVDHELNSTPQRTKYPNRGRTHFRRPAGVTERASSNGDLAGENYPAEFLEAHTRKPEFRITVAPSEEDAEEYDQVPYSSLYRPKIVAKNPEQGGSESKWSNKYTSTYFRKHNNTSNEIAVTNKIETINTTNTNDSSEGSTSTSSPNEAQNQEENSKSIFEQIFEEMAKFGMSETTTETAKTVIDSKPEESVGEIKVTKGKKRGFWKRVRVRPVDVLETAESQYVGSASNNLISDSAKKLYPRPTIEQYVITFEPDNETIHESDSYLPEKDEPVQDMVTVLPEETTTGSNEETVTELPFETTNIVPIQESQQVNTEPESIYSLFDMFNIPHLEQESRKPESIKNDSSNNLTDKTQILTDEEVPTTTDLPEDSVETTTISDVTTIQNDELNASTENQLNETKIINDKIKMYTERLENMEEKSKANVQAADMLDSLILGTSTSTEISHETEICYRGRCVKSNTTDITTGKLP